jgi:hypothetical protein
MDCSVKSTLIIAGSISTFLFSFTIKEERDIYGTWKGGFGNEKVITETIVELKPQNKAVVYEGGQDPANMTTGEYEVKGDTAFILTYYQPCTQKKVLLHGALNKSKTFVDGVWQSASEEKGSFYLEKQPL